MHSRIWHKRVTQLWISRFLPAFDRESQSWGKLALHFRQTNRVFKENSGRFWCLDFWIFFCPLRNKRIRWMTNLFWFSSLWFNFHILLLFVALLPHFSQCCNKKFQGFFFDWKSHWHWCKKSVIFPFNTIQYIQFCTGSLISKKNDAFMPRSIFTLGPNFAEKHFKTIQRKLRHAFFEKNLYFFGKIKNVLKINYNLLGFFGEILIYCVWALKPHKKSSIVLHWIAVWGLTKTKLFTCCISVYKPLNYTTLFWG